MKTVLLFGTFDFLHIGHLSLFQQAKELGDRLVVSVGQDANIEQLKGKAPEHTLEERLALVRSIRLVDEAIPGDTTIGAYTVFDIAQPDIVLVGYDQQELGDHVRSFIAEHGLDIDVQVAAPYKEGQHKSSVIKKLLQ